MFKKIIFLCFVISLSVNAGRGKSNLYFNAVKNTRNIKQENKLKNNKFTKYSPAKNKKNNLFYAVKSLSFDLKNNPGSGSRFPIVFKSCIWS